jgi:hypothetical protein
MKPAGFGHIGKMRPTRLYASDHPKIAFEQYYYYSQPLDGGRDDNAIEDFFNPPGSGRLISRQERVLTPKRRPPLSYVSFVVAIATRSLDAAFEARSAATAVPAAQA